MTAQLDKASREYVRLLQNPYASVQVSDSVEELTATIRSPTRHSTPSVKPPARQPAQVDLFDQQQTACFPRCEENHGNPYARIVDDDEPPAKRGEVEVSQAGFKAECRRIFRQYIPLLECDRLRREHREFITRNLPRPARVRFKLLEALRRYDLSDLPQMQPQFNREDDRLTAQKLMEIERDVGKEE